MYNPEKLACKRCVLCGVTSKTYWSCPWNPSSGRLLQEGFFRKTFPGRSFLEGVSQSDAAGFLQNPSDLSTYHPSQAIKTFFAQKPIVQPSEAPVSVQKPSDVPKSNQSTAAKASTQAPAHATRNPIVISDDDVSDCDLPANRIRSRLRALLQDRPSADTPENDDPHRHPVRTEGVPRLKVESREEIRNLGNILSQEQQGRWIRTYCYSKTHIFPNCPTLSTYRVCGKRGCLHNKTKIVREDNNQENRFIQEIR
ncbi:hypothetical protein F5Y10DRAFT_62928 [Nemania abortiva]|nr:hypothetical protein F5Y10DRAFT_62928 [Nemania abortiva]